MSFCIEANLSALAISKTGATPVFVEPDLDYCLIDPTKIEEKITPNTKAIMPVHIFGNPCNMAEIERIANDLEDNVDYYETDEEDNERTAAINKLSDAIASASEESDSEEDALDMLDNDEINRVFKILKDKSKDI